MTGGKVYLERFARDNILYANNTNILAKLNFTAKDSLYSIEKGILTLDDLRFETTGLITSGKNIYTDIKIEGQTLNIRSLIKVLPDYLVKWSNDYIAEGKADIDIFIKGKFSSTEIPLINSGFTLTQGSLRTINREIYPKNISFTGPNNPDEVNFESFL